MIWVAVLADKSWAVLMQDTMQGGRILPLRGHLRMASHAPVCHDSRTPEGGVAGLALAADVGMGGDAAQRRARLGIQRAGVEQGTALHQPQP